MLREKNGDWRCSQEAVLLKQILLIDTWSLPKSMARRWARGWHVQVTLRGKIVPIELIYITTRMRLSILLLLLLPNSSRCSSFFVWWNVEYGKRCMFGSMPEYAYILPHLAFSKAFQKWKFSLLQWKWFLYRFFFCMTQAWGAQFDGVTTKYEGSIKRLLVKVVCI